MRLRNVPGSRDRIAESEYVVQSPRNAKGRWAELFEERRTIPAASENTDSSSETGRPLHIEIGCGKGQFIYTLASLHPKVNYVAIEKFSSVLLRVIQKQEARPLPNLLLIRMDAEEIADVFAKDEVGRIYLNFSDPWPKDRHAKRRLPSRQFLAKYDSFLKKDGSIEFKTDNKDLFEFALAEAPAAGWRIDKLTYDLHNDPAMNMGNIMTEYEEKFSAMGNPIFKCVLSR